MIEVLKTGILTTIQDQGRYGFRDTGVPVSGVMDQYLAMMANQLVGNCGDQAIMEMTFLGPELKFHQSAIVAVCCGGQKVYLNDREVIINTVIELKKGDVLKLGSISTGVRSYLAVAGGIDTEKKLNSRSYYQGVTSQAILEKGDSLKIRRLKNNIKNRTVIKLDNNHFENLTLEVYPGPEFEQLSNDMKTKLLRQKFIISNQSNRMAYQFEKKVTLSAKEIITSSVQPGTVQLTPSGELIVLMRDCQTTGGYSRIFQLSDKSINQLAQKPAGTELNFVIITETIT